MIGIVLAAHGPLPDALLESARMILGDPGQIVTVTLMPGDSLEGLVERLRAAVEEVSAGDGVLILLDLFGGTPSNAAALLTQQLGQVYAVSGINVPMLLETLLDRQHSTDVRALAATAFESGQRGVVDIVTAFEEYRKRRQSEAGHE
jgi:mannose/fructose/sorbose-specific phosphotransferase system IIA component